MLTATLPYPPTVNHYWCYAKGRVFISPEGRAYRRRVQGILQDVPELSGDVRLLIAMHPPDKRRRDIDNVLKCLLDSLVHAGAMRDDSQITELAIIKDTVVPQGMVKIEAAKAGGDER
jgi:crossover junction endodeoxyribonuclease RusA